METASRRPITRYIIFLVILFVLPALWPALAERQAPRILGCRIEGGRADDNYPRYFKSGSQIPVTVSWSFSSAEERVLVSVTVDLLGLPEVLADSRTYIYDAGYADSEREKTIQLTAPEAETGSVYRVRARVTAVWADNYELASEYDLPDLSVYIDNKVPGPVRGIELPGAAEIGGEPWIGANTGIEFTWGQALDFESDVARYWLRVARAGSDGASGAGTGSTSEPVWGEVENDSGGTWTYTGEELADGRYDLLIRAEDYAGNLGSIVTQPFTVEAAPPDVPALVCTTPNPTNSGVQEWSLSSSDDAVGFELGVCESQDGEPSSWTEINPGDPARTEIADDGVHYVKARAYNAFHLCSAWSEAVPLIVDMTPPAPPRNLVTGGSPTNDNRPVWKWETPGSDAVRFEISLDGCPPVDLGSAASYRPSQLADGPHRLKVRAVDALGNASDWTDEAEVIVDTASPEPPVLTLVTPSPTNAPEQIWSWTQPADATGYILGRCDSAEGEPNSYVNLGATETYTTYLSAEGAYYLKIRAYDEVGNTSAWSDAASVVIDLTPPGTPTGLCVESPTTEITPTWTWPAEADVNYDISLDGGPPVNAGTSGTYTSGVLADGAHSLRVRARDTAGNISGWSSPAEVTIDSHPPAVPEKPMTPSPTAQGEQPWSWTPVDDPDLAYYDVLIDGEQMIRSEEADFETALGEGRHYFQVRSVDALGNASNWSEAAEVVVDMTGPDAPVVTLASISEDHTAQTWRWTVPEDAAGFDFGLSTDGESAPEKYIYLSYADSCITHLVNPGAYYIMVRAYDALGNPSPWSQAAVLEITASPGSEGAAENTGSAAVAPGDTSGNLQEDTAGAPENTTDNPDGA